MVIGSLYACPSVCPPACMYRSSVFVKYSPAVTEGSHLKAGEMKAVFCKHLMLEI
jgi:hypothetical protein